MTRAQLLRLLIHQARTNGFAFRRWFEKHTGMAWISAENALDWLTIGERANLLIFSQPFARRFWHSGDRVTFVVPQQTFVRVTNDGSTRLIERRAHVRRSSHTDVWRYHMREMAAAPEPLRYIRRFLLVEEDLATPHETEHTPSGQDEDYDDALLVREAK